MRISMLAIGSEILDGRVLDTNSNFIANELSIRGYRFVHTLVCDDVESEILAALSFLAASSDVVIVSGGLGPTSDDITRDAVARFAGTPLYEDVGALQRLHERFQRRNRPLDPLNVRQTLFPTGAQIIPNAVGTAEGFSVQAGSTTIFCVPGVPKEMRPMWTEVILPAIEQRAGHATPLHRRSFRVFGLPEATVGRKLESLSLPSDIVVSYRAAFPEIHVVLKGYDQSNLEIWAPKAIAEIGNEYVFTINRDESVVDVVGRLLAERSQTLSVAESCTGGMLGMQLTSISGSSRYFVGGAISYSNALKISTLGVQQETLNNFGAVSSETAIEMAAGAQKRFASDFALSVTGIAGPEGGSEEKPVGLFHVGLATPQGVHSFKRVFTSDRASVRRYATFTACDILRRAIIGAPQIA